MLKCVAEVETYNKMLNKFLVLLLLAGLVYSQTACTLENCDECDPAVDPPEACLTCHGWYEASWDTGLCVTSARLIIATVVLLCLAIAVVTCIAMKAIEYNKTNNSRPTNIESLPSNVTVSEGELKSLKWNNSDVRGCEPNTCGACQQKGGTVKLSCEHIFHGDCVCWELSNRNSCPSCGSVPNRLCKIYCMKCLSSYMDCPTEWYPEVKKSLSRVCTNCVKRE